MADAMTPRDALHALADLPHYEERLEEQDLLVVLAVLWVPWVAGGSALTAMLWSSHAVSLRRRPDSAQGVRLSLGITLLFLVLAAAVFGTLDVLLGVEWTINGLMAIASGLCAGALGLWQRKAWGPAAGHLVVAGVAMVAAGLAIGLSGMASTPAGLTAASAVGRRVSPSSTSRSGCA